MGTPDAPSIRVHQPTKHCLRHLTKGYPLPLEICPPDHEPTDYELAQNRFDNGDGTDFWHKIREAHALTMHDVEMLTSHDGGIVEPELMLIETYGVQPTLDQVIILARIYGRTPTELLDECWSWTVVAHGLRDDNA